jgi:DNA-binding NarL/FixJ family response regulator
MDKIKVFIVDDHYMVIEGIQSLLERDPDIEIIGHASTAVSCLSFLDRQEPDVILLDISLPDMSGIDLCREIKKDHPAVYVLGLSTFNQFSFIEKMLEMGASGYLLKNATKQELSIAIKNVSEGKRYLSYEASMTLRDMHAASSGAPVLTRREKEILQLISEGFTNPAIAEKLFISLTTVETHRKNLLAKFKVKNTAILIKTASENKMIS